MVKPAPKFDSSRGNLSFSCPKMRHGKKSASLGHDEKEKGKEKRDEAFTQKGSMSGRERGMVIRSNQKAPHVRNQCSMTAGQPAIFSSMKASTSDKEEKQMQGPRKRDRAPAEKKV